MTSSAAYEEGAAATLRSRNCCCRPVICGSLCLRTTPPCGVNSTGTSVTARNLRPVDGAEEFEAKEALEDAAALEGLKGFTELALDMGAYLDVMGEARCVTHPVHVLPMELRGVTNG